MHRRHLLSALAAAPWLSAATPARAEPDTGLYAAPVYAMSQVLVRRDIVYVTRSKRPGEEQYTDPNTAKQETAAAVIRPRLDLMVPPNASAQAPQPLIVVIHGGGFRAGFKSDERAGPVAQSYAQAGYVVASLNYRMTSDQDTPDKRRLTVIRATEDVMDAIRFLKRNDNRFFFDRRRIATIGGSAGGAMSLTNAVQYDTLDGAASAYPGVSSRVATAVATGATLYDYFVDKTTGEKTLIDYGLDYDAADSPVMMFHANPQDSTTKALWTQEVAWTQAAIQGSGNVCLTYPQPDQTHTVPLDVDPGNVYWTDGLRPFLWEQLRLDALRPPA